ncbi:MAG TPA: YqhR family membrane protein, partial [Virgibacillus sp.]|nr:YqhR family membrane protein [Virgibacillus sp.]
AFIYYGLLKKVISMWMGVVYGLILWGIIFYILQPVFPTLTPVVDFDKETIVTTLGLFILYGTFIGYSISFDYNDMRIKEKKENQS